MRHFLRKTALAICALLMTAQTINAQNDANDQTTVYTISPSYGLDYGTTKPDKWKSISTDEYPAVISISATDAQGNTVNAISCYNDKSHKFYATGLIAGTETMATAPTIFTLSVPEGYLITGYSLTYHPTAGGKKITVANELGYNETLASTREDYVMAAEGLSTRSTSFTVSGQASHAITTLEFTATIVKEGDETGIKELVDESKAKAEIYDLTGRRIESITQPGIYIVNGRKVYKK